MKSFTSSIFILCVLPLANAATVAEIENNNSHTTAQSIGPLNFTSEFVANIESSTTYKHATIDATGDGTVDWFTLNHTGGRIILDIDGGMPTVDLELGLWDLSGNLIFHNDDYDIDPGSVHQFDSYIDSPSLASGLYYIAVSAFPSTQAANFVVGGGGFTTSGYQLHISSGAVPEPSSTILVGLASLTLFVRRRR